MKGPYFYNTKTIQRFKKRLAKYLENAQTAAFINSLSRSVRIRTRRLVRIRTDLLVQKIMNGPNNKRGTWVHPRVATHLAQWVSPAFAVKVSGWFTVRNVFISTWRNLKEMVNIF